MPSLPEGAGGLLAAVREDEAGNGVPLDAWNGEPRSLLVAALVHWGRQPADADDLVEELVLAAIRTVRAGMVVERELPWMAGVLGNLWLKELRRRRREEEKEKEKEKPHEEEGPLDVLVREEEVREDHAKVLDACRALPRPYGQVLWWRSIDGLSIQEIREKLSAFQPVTENEVWRLLREARAMARGLWTGIDPRTSHPGRYRLDRNHWVGIPLPRPWEQ